MSLNASAAPLSAVLKQRIQGHGHSSEDMALCMKAPTAWEMCKQAANESTTRIALRMIWCMGQCTECKSNV
jgi:hypothetical protein